jgi:uncharacterized protein with HEPN domain
LTSNTLAIALETIKECAQDALVFTDGMTVDDFLGDRKTQAAVVMTLVRIGESAAEIASAHPDFVAAHLDWPWQHMRAIRNRAAHRYDSVNFRVIWDVISSTCCVDR